MSYVVSKNKAKYSTRYQRRKLGESERPPASFAHYVSKWADKLIVAGCALIFLTVVSLLIIGIYTVCTWLFL
ncbi:hypothetical protein F6Y03_05915 [Bacillus megaterium]|nr:hypothetical protein [Priestia megaterium]